MKSAGEFQMVEPATEKVQQSTEKLNQTQRKPTCIHNKIYYNIK